MKKTQKAFAEYTAILDKLSHRENTIKKHSVLLSGHATSITLEDDFWILLKYIAKQQNKPINQLISEIDHIRAIPLSSALRLFVLNMLLEQLPNRMEYFDKFRSKPI